MDILERLDGKLVKVDYQEKEIFILGTAHVSRDSVREVREVISEIRPESVCVELCESRYESIFNEDKWKDMDIVKVIKQNKAFYLLMQLVLSSFYKKIGEKLGVRPGADMIEAVEAAKEIGAQVVLADRDVNVTLKRVWGYLSFLKKMKLLGLMLSSVFSTDDISEEDIEKLRQKDQLEIALEEVARSLPEVKQRLIDERDVYLAEKIKSAPGKRIVAVVGYGHVNGIVSNIHKQNDITPLETIPKKGKIVQFLKWLIPLLIIGLLTYGFIKGGKEFSYESISIWVGVNGTLSALGVALALAHPLTIVSAFLAAPITSLNPMIAAGWVAGLVQAWVRKPRVHDIEELPTAITSVKGFWTNPVTKILLVVAFANIGSSIGTFLAGSMIASKLF
ncbi:TraB/GumN family protein [Desulfothermus okinawensis JCM 13304]